jgi:hypothetical protein
MRRQDLRSNDSVYAFRLAANWSHALLFLLYNDRQAYSTTVSVRSASHILEPVSNFNKIWYEHNSTRSHINISQIPTIIAGNKLREDCTNF